MRCFSLLMMWLAGLQTGLVAMGTILHKSMPGPIIWTVIINLCAAALAATSLLRRP